MLNNYMKQQLINMSTRAMAEVNLFMRNGIDLQLINPICAYYIRMANESEGYLTIDTMVNQPKDFLKHLRQFIGAYMGAIYNVRVEQEDAYLIKLYELQEALIKVFPEFPRLDKNQLYLLEQWGDMRCDYPRDWAARLEDILVKYRTVKIFALDVIKQTQKKVETEPTELSDYLVDKLVHLTKKQQEQALDILVAHGELAAVDAHWTPKALPKIIEKLDDEDISPRSLPDNEELEGLFAIKYDLYWDDGGDVAYVRGNSFLLINLRTEQVYLHHDSDVYVRHVLDKSIEQTVIDGEIWGVFYGRVKLVNSYRIDLVVEDGNVLSQRGL